MKPTTTKPTSTTTKPTTPTAPTTKPAPATKRVRGPLVKTPITAADAVPGIVVLPVGIEAGDPAKTLPLVIEKFNAAQAEVNRLKDELAAKCSAFNTAEAYLKTVRAALDCNDDAQLAERAQKLQDVAAKTQKLQDDLSTTRTRLGASEREVFDLKTAREGYETGRRDIQVRLEKALLDLKDSQETALSLQQDLATASEQLRLAEQGRDKAISERDELTCEKNVLVDKVLGMEALDGAMREAQARESAIIGMFKVFDADKAPPTTINLAASVNSLFLERNNARALWETAQNNVNRLRAENERWESILGRLFTKLQSVYPETAEYRDMEGAVTRLIDTTKSSLSEVDEATDFAGKWQGRAYFIGALLTAASLYICLHLIGVVK